MTALLDTIRIYQRGLDDFNRRSRAIPDEEWSSLADQTYEPPLDILTDWKQPAETLEEAIEALRIALTDAGGVYGCDAADSMVRAAMGYMEGLRP